MELYSFYQPGQEFKLYIPKEHGNYSEIVIEGFLKLAEPGEVKELKEHLDKYINEFIDSKIKKDDVRKVSIITKDPHYSLRDYTVSRLYDKIYSSYIENNPNLTELNCDFMRDDNYEILNLPHPDKLEKLSIKVPFGSKKASEAINSLNLKQMISLESLSIDLSNNKVGYNKLPELVKSITQLPSNLKEFSIDISQIESNYHLRSPEEFMKFLQEIIHHLPKDLEKLSLSFDDKNLHFINDKKMEKMFAKDLIDSISKSCPQLTKLDLKHGHNNLGEEICDHLGELPETLTEFAINPNPINNKHYDIFQKILVEKQVIINESIAFEKGIGIPHKAYKGHLKVETISQLVTAKKDQQQNQP